MTGVFPLRKVYGVPLALAAITMTGLLFALFGDGAWDAASWVLLSAPLLLVLFVLLRRRA